MVGEPESVVLSVKEKDRKRRRDGSSSRSHHGKKLKELWHVQVLMGHCFLLRLG